MAAAATMMACAGDCDGAGQVTGKRRTTSAFSCGAGRARRMCTSVARRGSRIRPPTCRRK